MRRGLLLSLVFFVTLFQAHLLWSGDIPSPFTLDQGRELIRISADQPAVDFFKATEKFERPCDALLGRQNPIFSAFMMEINAASNLGLRQELQRRLGEIQTHSSLAFKRLAIVVGTGSSHVQFADGKQDFKLEGDDEWTGWAPGLREHLGLLIHVEFPEEQQRAQTIKTPLAPKNKFDGPVNVTRISAEDAAQRYPVILLASVSIELRELEKNYRNYLDRVDLSSVETVLSYLVHFNTLADWVVKNETTREQESDFVRKELYGLILPLFRDNLVDVFGENAALLQAYDKFDKYRDTL